MADNHEAKPGVFAPVPNESANRDGTLPERASESTTPPSEPGKAAIEDDLPIIESPRLDAAEPSPSAVGLGDYTPHDATAEPVQEAPAPARSYRFALLAAAVAIAAAFGSVVGSLSATGFAHLWHGSSRGVGIADAYTLQAVKAEIAELTALKAELDGATHGANGQFAKIADRLDRIERAQGDPGKIAHIADTVDRLEKRGAASSEITGAIAASQSSAPEAKTSDRILQDWIVQDVQNGRALVESRYGGVFDIASGSMLPGLGRVESIKRQDGQWVVVTAHGLITSGH